jgi:AraC-like DNA-binding protein
MRYGVATRELRERLCAATTTDQRFAILEAELLSRLDQRPVAPVVTYALDVLARPEARVRDIAKRVGLSQRRLIELFTAVVGLTPKRFGRVPYPRTCEWMGRKQPRRFRLVLHGRLSAS